MNILSNDLINATFELGGAFANCLSIRCLWRDKKLMGVHWAPTLYFLIWGMWNVWYYPALGQWVSFFGACTILLTNLVWIASLIYFVNKGKSYEELHP